MSIPAKVVNAVYRRAGIGDLHDLGPYCEACGGLIGTRVPALHHRLLRSAGGQHTAENLMLVHSECHNVAPGSIHQNPTRSYRLGHLVHRGQDPATVPVIVARDLRDLRS